MILYCDVDGTLAWGDKANWGLVDSIRNFLDAHPDFSLVVWSHAGVKHARSWASRTFGGSGYEAKTRVKDFTAVRPGDLVVDNMRLPFGILPGQFVAQERAGFLDTSMIGPSGLPPGPDGWAYDPKTLKQYTERMNSPEGVKA